MNTSIYIAKRYLFSKKQTHAINIISGISILGVLVGSAALIIILSVFNGLESVILSLYSNFTPELKIEPRMGKTFDPNTPYFNALGKDVRVVSYTQVLQEKALIRYSGRSFIATVKGVSDDFLKGRMLDSTIQFGSFTLKDKGENFAVIGSTVQGSLGVSLKNQFTSLQVFSPRRNAGTSTDPMNDFVFRSIQPSGVFGIQQDFDGLIITPIEFTRDLLDQPNQVSSLELNYKTGTDLDQVQEAMEERIGKSFTIRNRKEQNTELYKTINYERWSIFMILTFVLIIAIFNIIGSLTMLVIDKRKDIAILTSLGANKGLIQRIFFFEGMMISFIGCVTGLALGLIVCLIQKQFGFIKMGSALSVLDAYPVAFKLSDIGLVFLTVTVIAVIASGISSSLSVKRLDEIKQDL
ncbi:MULTISPECIES: FtsX-like permease family protein [unclassified Mucilaginibacter]|uniref:FtsX-like permease family protein n=1 Tax=unclassified Mucilaginibacter TaxID=2617802 RepID=UPI002AC8E2D0|nr:MULTISPECIES: FtsX-like permease family protein [unclassified Mucilaginibacter]MEB0263774.1 ABC transporter permease [Mucilaginibacter sp. 10I4]MEB0280241.1 ABC transporter permease [Mucilaginibacter sp. 10B2]MEB0301136.1 ABC transporter permease [Mucilaginibacter sp. 5C4]WPX24350.1 FtsX-like permease family protein [Mucilaginibacter sp. 5C4]